MPLGFDWIVEFDNEDKGIGVSADQIAPFFGGAFSQFYYRLVMNPLVQQFARLIALQPFGEGYWAKLDAKTPYDWENERWPVSAEIQVGYYFDPSCAIHADGLAGIGNDRPYDASADLGLRFERLLHDHHVAWCEHWRHCGRWGTGA